MRTEDYVALISAFALGSVPFAWLIAKLWGIEDLRKEGSTNVGATNVVRTAGLLPGALTFLLDFAKGVAPILYFGEPKIWIGLAAVLGHCFSPLLSFRGGKGVSTTLGAAVAFNPILGASAVGAYLFSLLLTRVSALGSLFAMLTLLAGSWIFIGSIESKIGIGLIGAVVLARHRENWDKLLKASLALAFFVLLSPKDAQATTDYRGKKVESAKTPTRIAALIPSLAETVVELGNGRQLVAAPDYARLPNELEGKIARLGAYTSISAEAVYAAHPDLVLASMDGNDAKLVAQLEKLGLRVITINTVSLDDIVRSMEIVGAALGKPAHPEIEKMRRALRIKPGSGKSIFIQIGWDPIVTVSSNTFIHELIERAGGRNVFAKASMKYPRPNAEEVIAQNPDAIILCKLTDTGSETEKARQFWSRFTKLNAVRNKQIHVIPGDWLVKPNTSLIRGIEELRRIL